MTINSPKSTYSNLNYTETLGIVFENTCLITQVSHMFYNIGYVCDGPVIIYFSFLCKQCNHSRFDTYYQKWTKISCRITKET